MRLRTGRLALFIGIPILAVLIIIFITMPNKDNTQPLYSAGSLALPSFKETLDKAEQAKNETDLLRERLIEQGYSDEVLDGLLASGAERAVQIPYIAAVAELYGSPWNLPLNVDEFTLVDLYIVGDRFVLGFYEDETAEHVIWLHMSVTETYESLQANLDYTHEEGNANYTTHLDGIGIIGFAFGVLSGEELVFTRYVATASHSLSLGTIENFIGSVVDGTLAVDG